MKKRSVKILSLVLALIMAFSLCPMQVFAEGNQWGWGESQGPEMPAQQLKATDNESGVSVTVEAPEGALPQGTTMNVKAVNLPAVQTIVDNDANVSGSVVAAVDITFYYQGTEIEPEKSVSVTLASDVIANARNPRVLHLDASAEEVESGNVPVEVMSAGTVANGVSFKADDFSVYAVLEDNTHSDYDRLQVRFFHHEGDTEPVYSVYVTKRNADILDHIIDDPQVPTDLSSNQLFCGWSVGTNYTASDVDGQHTVDYIRGQVKTYLQTHEIHEGDKFDVYAMIFNYFNVAYVDENNETTLATDVYYSKDPSMELTVQLTYAPYEQGYRFQGWEKDDGDTTIYQNGDTTTITEPVTKLHAQVQQGFWLSFEENPGEHYKGASYVPPVFCVNGVIPSNAMPTDPTLKGYTLGDGTNKWFSTFVKGETEADDVWSNPFSFSGTLTQDTTVYAKWTLDDYVNYTIIVWKQNINDDKAAADSAKTYDYAFAVTKEVAPNTPVADLINISEADLLRYTQLAGKTVTVDSVKHSFFGFTYNETKGVVSKDTKVKADGTTVVNLYYDRELCSIKFMTQQYSAISSHPTPGSAPTSVTGTPLSPVYFISYNGEYCPISYYSSRYNYIYRPTTASYSSQSTQYAVIDGALYLLTYDQSSSGTYYWWYYSSGDSKYHIWNGQRYYRSTNTSTTSYTYYTRDWAERETYTGLYDQKLSKYSYTWPTDYRWMNDDPNGNIFTSIMDCFASSGETLLYGVDETFDANVYHFLQNSDGTWPTSAAFTIPCKTTDGMVFRSFSGYSSNQYRVKLPSGVRTYYLTTDITSTGTGDDKTYSFTWGSAKTSSDYHDGAYWTEWIDSDVQVKYDGFEPNDDTHRKPVGGKIEFRYARVKMPISYVYGTFVTGRDVEMAPPFTGQLKQTDPIFFEASVDSYKKDGGANYYDPVAAGDFTDSSFLFEGWYVDPGCTTPYDFAGKTMLQGGITVYAKFRQREFRVFLHVNEEGKQWSDVSWNDPDQASNFRIAYDGIISEGNPIEGSMEGYVLVGWYTDQACTNPYNFSTRYTDESMAGLAQEYGATQKADPQYATEADGTNKDVDRPWINKMVHLYAKWRKVLPGAAGITLVYDAIQEAGVTGKTGTFTVQVDGGGTSTVTTLTDPLRYTDTANFLSHAASTPDNPEDYQFLYWVILDKDGNPTDEIVYPGMIHPVDADYAVVTDAPTASGNAVTPALQTRGPVRGSSSDVYQAVSAPEVGHSYLMGYVSGSTAYLIGNTYYNTSNCPRAVSATVSGGEITGDYEQYLWTVSDNSSQQLLFQNATAGYLGLNSSYYLNFGTSYNTWTVSNNKVVNTTSATAYTKIVYSSGYFDVTNSTGSNITFFELVEQGNPVTYTKVETPVAGISYVIAEDGVNYALSGTHHANTVDPESGHSWLNAVEIQRSGDTVTILDTQAADLTWTAGGSAASGWTWQNVGNSKYLNYTTASDAYLTVKTSAASWQYTGDKYFYCAAITDSYNYMVFSDDDGYNDYTVSKSGSAIGLYALTHTLTINYVYGDGTTASTTHTEQIPEGVAYSVTSPTISGYNADTATVSGTMGTSDVTVTVTYTAASHTVTFNWHGGSSTQTVDDGDYATAPADPGSYTENGVTYIFIGWDPNPANTPVTSDLIITAQYKKEGACIVTFKDWNGRVLKVQEVTKGQDATPPANPTREGFTFAGWDKDYTNVQSDLVIYATYRTAVTKVYTVTLRAVYGPRAKQELTHIVWYANNGTGDYMQSKGVVMNENIEIPIPSGDWATGSVYDEWAPTNENGGDLVWANHEFLGWARVAESDMDGQLYWTDEPSAHPDHINLSEADLFLKYDPSTKTYKANQNCAIYDTRANSGSGAKAETEITWAGVNYVAADELMPYHAMYAVWGTVFYVYHSGTGKVERIVIDSSASATSGAKAGDAGRENKTFNLTNIVSDGFLYGGYYTEYAGMGANFDVTSADLTWRSVSAADIQTGTADTIAAAPATDASVAYLAGNGRISQTTDDDCVTYTAANIAATNWDLSKATTTVAGNAIVPEAGATYFIKEVPADMYLRHYTHFTYRYGSGAITKIFLISDIDDGNYNQAGFVIVDQVTGAKFVTRSLTVTNSNTGLSQTLTPSSLFGTKGVTDKGYLTCYMPAKASDMENKNVLNYWVTPDGLLVTGACVRAMSGTSYSTTIQIATLESNQVVSSTIGKYKPAS